MKVIFCYLLVLFSYFLYDTDILRLSTVIQRNSLLKLTAAVQNPDADNNPISELKLQLELLYSRLDKVTYLLYTAREMWRVQCRELVLSQLLEDICKKLLAFLREIVNQQEEIRMTIFDAEEEIRNLQAANN